MPPTQQSAHESVIPESEFERVLGEERNKKLREKAISRREDMGWGGQLDDDAYFNERGEFDKGLYALKTIENVKGSLDLAKKHAARMLKEAAEKPSSKTSKKGPGRKKRSRL